MRLRTAFLSLCTGENRDQRDYNNAADGADDRDQAVAAEVKDTGG